MYGVRLAGAASSTMVVANDGVVKQTVGVGSTAIGKIISYDNTTKVLNYWQDRSMADGSASALHQYSLNRFTKTPGTGGSLNIVVKTIGGEETLTVDTAFTGVSTTINNRTYYLGQTYNSGIASPEIKKYSGDIIYVDNRPEVTRASNQREDIKIILEF
jgi:hypothetical protein